MALVTDIAVIPAGKERSSVIHFLVRLFREKPLGAAGGVIFILFLLCGMFADFLAPYGMPVCKIDQPLLRNIGPERAVACHLHAN